MEKSNDTSKLKLAIYWGAACGGCCVSVLDVHEHLYDIVAAADLVFWPIKPCNVIMRLPYHYLLKRVTQPWPGSLAP